jgi:membrane-associated protease RseP (regulator of RpoE activity)
MKIAYLVYFLAGLIISFLVLFYLGASAGFSNYIPIIALCGSMLLFLIAAPLTVCYPKQSLYIGLLGAFLTVPYVGIFSGRLLFGYKGAYHWSLLFVLLPSVVVVMSIYLTLKLLKKEKLSAVGSNYLYKSVCVLLPITLFLLYIIFYGDQWSSQMLYPN